MKTYIFFSLNAIFGFLLLFNAILSYRRINQTKISEGSLDLAANGLAQIPNESKSPIKYYVITGTLLLVILLTSGWYFLSPGQRSEQKRYVNSDDAVKKQPSTMAPIVTDESNFLGMKLKDLDQTLAQRFHLRETKGLVVVNVETISPAAEANVIPGDLLMELNLIRLESIKDFRDAMKKVKKGSSAKLLVKRRGSIILLSIDCPDT